jgi:hypothetical protein
MIHPLNGILTGGGRSWRCHVRFLSIGVIRTGAFDAWGTDHIAKRSGDVG